ncbi:hypothetical protein HYV80_00865 [Candidatus Woesearchaeota archaeon]|nr:hypothetical protein [Candidatus Woesearchaeota archaeon]
MKKIKKFWSKLEYWKRGGIIGLIGGMLFSSYIWILFGENSLFFLILPIAAGGAILGYLWELGKKNKLELKGKSKIIIYGYLVILLMWLSVSKIIQLNLNLMLINI